MELTNNSLNLSPFLQEGTQKLCLLPLSGTKCLTKSQVLGEEPNKNPLFIEQSKCFHLYKWLEFVSKIYIDLRTQLRINKVPMKSTSHVNNYRQISQKSTFPSTQPVLHIFFFRKKGMIETINKHFFLHDFYKYQGNETQHMTGT